MKFKFNAVVAAAALIASAGAHAAVQTATAVPGNSSAVFVAWSQGAGVSLTVNLGVNLTDFLQSGASFSGASTPVGSLAYTGSPLTASWDLAGDARSVNGTAVSGSYSWSAALSDFNTARGANSYTWGVFAADNVSGAVSASNVLLNRNVLATFNNLDASKIAGLSSAGTTSTAAGNINNFLVGSTSGTLGGTNGAGTATAGAGYIGTTIRESLGAYSGWNYLSALGASAPVFMVNQLGDPDVYQIGKTYGKNTILDVADAASFSFDGTSLTYQVAAVPEASTIAMMLAGLGALGLMARRRNAA